jgi:glycosyltransferase involved in cell wall biosynthesis
MSAPTVSVVVPVHGTEPYVAECLTSILQQTLPEIEVLAVDDASPDDAPMVLERFAASDDRVTVLRRDVQDRGPGAARNLGLTHARGRYVAFVDSDDRIHPEMLARLVEEAERVDADVAMCMLRTFDDDGEHDTACSYDQVIPVELDGTGFTWRDLGPALFDLRFASCNKVYRRDFLSRCRLTYPEDRFYEDLPFTFRVLLEATTLSFVRAPLYLNRKGREDATTFLQGDRVVDALTSLEDLREVLVAADRYRDLLPAFEAFEFRKLVHYLPYNDRAHVEPFYDALQRVARTEALASSTYLNPEQQELRERIVGSNLDDFLLWRAWHLQQRYLGVSRRLARAQAQREAFRTQIHDLRDEQRRLVRANRALTARSTVRGRWRERLAPGRRRLRRLAERVLGADRIAALRGRREPTG